MSLLQQAFEKKEFAITAEMAPPKGTDLAHLIECAKAIKGRAHGVNVTDFQAATVKATSLATCKMLKDAGLEPVLQITGRDRNRIAIEGELLSAGIFGIENVLALTGDYTVLGDHPGAKPVYDLDSVDILKVASTISSGVDMMGNELKGTPSFYLGACVSPKYDPLELQILKMKKKIRAGAKFFQTQAVYDIDTLRNFREMTKDLNTNVMVGIIPLKSAGMAKYMNANVAGVYVPDEIIERMKGAENKVQEGINIAAEFIKQAKEEGLCEGVHIMAIGAEENVPVILDRAGL
ncbi:methylenetetrahydrofolate reductase [Haloimpatiens lingqiaonensis]|uniref:methylenetetrahydrofolate reductase n=1 Tax=Haloimpatiens lingqiaonensis TaxID=1380675 RepID=UPI0010FEC646|nr:methylenetetrahydrofolate reductase [Haloimpatiens lingqiaonensis]